MTAGDRRPSAPRGSSATRRSPSPADALAALRDEAKAARKELERRTRQLSVLLKFMESIQGADDPKTILRRLVRGVVDSKSFGRASTVLLDADWNVVQTAHAGFTRQELKLLGTRPPLPPARRRSLLAARYRLGNSFFIPHDDPIQGALAPATIRSRRAKREFVTWHPDDILLIPLTARDGTVIGTLSVDDPADGHRPTAESLEILEIFARHTAVAIMRERIRAKLRRTEGYLQDLVVNSGDIIITTDPRGRIVLFNRGAQEILGYTAAEVVGESVIKIYASADTARDVARRLREEGRGRRRRLVDLETTLRAKSGELIPVDFSGAYILDEKGKVLGIAGISKDLRKLKKLQADLIDKEKLATVGEMSAALAHEIGNCLESIVSAEGLLGRELEEERALYREKGWEEAWERHREHVLSIGQGAQRIQRFVRRIQNVSGRDRYASKEYVEGIRMTDVGASPLGRRARILVADDEEEILRLLKELLESEGHLVELARDGKEAVQAGRHGAFDLVLSDIRMPGLNGYEVFDVLRREAPESKVILMTAFGYDPEHQLVKATKTGALASVLYKPFDPVRLKAAVDAALAESPAARAGRAT